MSEPEDRPRSPATVPRRRSARQAHGRSRRRAAAAAIFGSKYNVLSALNLPRIPVNEGTLATGGAIALAAILLGTVLASIFGGKAGRRYHRKVDELA